MKHTLIKALSVVAILAVLCMSATVYAETVESRIGKLDFDLGVPTEATVAKLYDEMDFQRACQLYLWALPVVNVAQATLTMKFETGAQDGDAVIYEGYHNLSGVLTPNVTTPYVAGGMDMSDVGPVVVDVPAGMIAGSAMDFWQRLLTDFGILGPDRGKGGKYLFVGPGQDVPNMEGATVVRCTTFRFMFYYRALDPDPIKAEALKKGVRIYPWSKRENPPAMRYLTPDPAKVAKIPAMPRGMAGIFPTFAGSGVKYRIAGGFSRLLHG